ncbi:MAG: hypothetical protein FD135_359 [Comamonadaceae bacterium]|nr:MAG: hypothetical protein FD135_359 [Comamonadaceae bacterium]
MTMDEPKMEGVQNTPSRAGELLRAARESQGIHIAMLAASLKVSAKKLEALEADRYDLLSDTVFVRALASSVCRSLKIDASPVLACLPRSELPRIKTDESGLNAVFSEASLGPAGSLLAQINRPLSIAIVLLFIGILAIFFWPSKSVDSTTASVVMDQAPQQVIAEPVLPPQVDVNASTADSAQSKLVDTLTGPAAPQLSASMAGVNQVQKVLTGSAVSAVPVSAASVAVSDNVLGLHSRGSSWVEVLDAQGVVQLRRVLNKDENIQLSGKLPLSVVLGRSDLIDVAVRGQMFDTTGLAKNNVARFEVK